jgi:Mpv17 / PMP22 family
MNLSTAAVFIASFVQLPYNTFSFVVVPNADVLVWSNHHFITAATSTLPQLPDLFGLYQNALHTLPLQTQMMTGAVLAVAGDVSAQAFDESGQIEPKRTLSFAAFDACYRAVQHIIYPPMKDFFHGQFLLHGISKILPSQTIIEQNLDQIHHHQVFAAAAEQSLVSQLVVIPLVYYPIFFAVTGMVQGLSWNQTIDRGLQSFVPLMQRNLLFWIPVQFAVFGWITDDAMQISILIACGFVWTMILSGFAGAAKIEATSNIDEQLQVIMAPDDSNRGVSIMLPVKSQIISASSRDMIYATISVSNSTSITEQQLL